MSVSLRASGRISRRNGLQRLLLIELILIQQGQLLLQLAVALFLCQALAAGGLQRRPVPVQTDEPSPCRQAAEDLQ